MEILFRNFMNIVLTLLLPVLYWIGDNTDLPSSCNISKAVIVNLAFIVPFFKKKKESFLVISRLIDFALVVL